MHRGSAQIARGVFVLCVLVGVAALVACGDSTTGTGTPPPLVDDRLIAFVSDSGSCCGGGSIFVMHADGSHKTRVTPDGSHDASPAWSPDGVTIAFTTDRSPNGIWVVSADGTGLRPLLAAPEFLGPGEAAWSPDGHSLAFSTAVRDSAGHFLGIIDIVDADGSHAHQLMMQAKDVGSPSWSADGTKIAFVAVSDR